MNQMSCAYWLYYLSSYWLVSSIIGLHSFGNVIIFDASKVGCDSGGIVERAFSIRKTLI